jgi:hypothetical protein
LAQVSFEGSSGVDNFLSSDESTKGALMKDTLRGELSAIKTDVS